MITISSISVSMLSCACTTDNEPAAPKSAAPIILVPRYFIEFPTSQLLFSQFQNTRPSGCQYLLFGSQTMKYRLRSAVRSYPGCAGNVELESTDREQTRGSCGCEHAVGRCACRGRGCCKGEGPGEAGMFRVAHSQGSFDQ